MTDHPKREPEAPDVTIRRDDVSATGAPTINMSPPPVPGAAPSSEAAGQWAVASRFDRAGMIGSGGMGSVAEVFDQLLLRRVAMKSMHAEMADQPGNTQRFLEEVQITAQLDHPHIVPVHDVGFHEQGAPFFIMKRVMGKTLYSVLQDRAGAPLTARAIEELMAILLKVCDAVAFAHSRGVIHRDLKPANIMVGSHGQVYVMDWGIALLHREDRRGPELQLARSTESHRQSGASLMGTAAYMAPEQAHASVDEIDERTDVFGLGAILYEILTGQPPYVADNTAVQLQMARECNIPHPIRVTDRRLPPGLCRIAMKALARRREDRYQSVDELGRAVAAFVRGGGWFDTLEFPPGAVIVSEGDEAHAAYIIDRGECEVYKTVGGDRVALRRLGPGDVFGETAIFTGKPRTASVVARTGVKVFAITRESLDYELAEKQWLAVFVKALAERFRDIDAELTERRVRVTPGEGGR